MNRPIFGGVRSPLSWWRERHAPVHRPYDDHPHAAGEAHLAGMVHELRNPLAAIAGLVNLLLEESFDESQQKTLLARVAATVAAMDMQVKNAFDLFLADQGRLRPNRRPSRLNQLVDECVARYAPAAQVKQLEIATDLGESPELELDPMHVDRIVSNLLLNAIRRTRSGRIAIATACSADRLSLKITDNGAPADAGELAQFFARPTELESNPSGDLGCHLARILVEIDGGTIQAINETGRGVATIVCFPIAPSKSPGG